MRHGRLFWNPTPLPALTNAAAPQTANHTSTAGQGRGERSGPGRPRRKGPIQRRIYLSGPLANVALSAAVLACTCLLTRNFEGLLPFAHGLICGATFGFGLGAANLTPFLPDGKTARLLARAARKGANPDLFPPPRSTAHGKAWAFLLGALTSLTATAAGYFLLIFAL